ncbi:MAG: hydroxypyruvate isomerase [Deltaproteobacteria bacterium]|nr:MAG: hydroxypyruvate isomerase [Deltaproteobacteria bacterium]
MPKLSANLSMLFTEVEFLGRFERAADVGFEAVEYLFPYSWEVDRLGEQLDHYDLQQVLFNLPAGNWEAGERGIAALPDRVGEFQDGVGLAIQYAKALKCPRLNCLAGLIPTGIPESNVRKTLVENLRFAADALSRENIRLLVEALNTRDVPGFYLTRTSEAVQLIEEVNHSNVQYQYDIYHMQIMEGDLTHTIRENVGIIGHMQLADNPGRHEPGTGEINFPNLFRFIDEAGYTGWIGCEYKPLGKTEDGLGWANPYL